MLKPITDPDAKTTGAWAKMNDINQCCPGCGKEIHREDQGIEYSRTKRGTYVFWHTGCTGKVWH